MTHTFECWVLLLSLFFCVCVCALCVLCLCGAHGCVVFSYPSINYFRKNGSVTPEYYWVAAFTQETSSRAYLPHAPHIFSLNNVCRRHAKVLKKFYMNFLFSWPELKINLTWLIFILPLARLMPISHPPR